MRGATCFSGIGAPEMGLPECNWIWHAEIEPFPSAVMAARHPESVNLGDVLATDFIERALAMGPLDIMAGGPPCQGFSIAGLRGGLSDPRGNLTLRWVQILHAIQPRNAITENVPGWLSMPDNAFGCFLAGLVGADDALSCPTGGSWPGVGMVAGPRARAAWRILDAQYFGVAQRRRRVFVVADFGNGADPAEILFERASGEGNFAPRREAGQEPSPTLAARTKGGGGLGTDFDCDGGLVTARMVAFGEYDSDGTASTIKQRDWKDATDLVAHSLRDEGFDGSEDGTGRGTPIVPVAIQAGALRENPNSGPDGVGVQSDLAYTLEARAEVQAVAFDTTQITSKANRSNPQPGDSCHTIAAGTHAPAVAWSIMPQNSGKDYKARSVDIAQPVMAGGPVGGNQGGDYVQDAWAVRRLTPTECSRLQGFPDDYCRITYRGKPAADGNIYKALGNSWAVPCGAWILKRTANALASTTATDAMERNG